MKRYGVRTIYVGTLVSLLSLVALLVDPFREWIFLLLTDWNIDYYEITYNPFTYLLAAFILFFIASIISLVDKTLFHLKVFCMAINGVGVTIVGFIVFMGTVL